MDHILPHNSQEEPSLLTPGFRTSSLQNRVMVSVCHLSHPVCVPLLQLPEKTNTDWVTKEARPMTKLPWSMERLCGSIHRWSDSINRARFSQRTRDHHHLCPFHKDHQRRRWFISYTEADPKFNTLKR